jgi:8-oxo-dGTP diphosphatase
MAERDGNGWVTCGLGHRHWGRHGAAGLLAYSRDGDGRTLVLLQHRAWWTASGGTWGTPGGARDSHETPQQAALREAAEECGLPPSAVRITGLVCEDHQGWSYQTLLGQAGTPLPVRAASPEATEVAWLPVAQVGARALHPGFAAQWPVIARALAPVTIIVDAANVMGARADGWWRDRVLAAGRLHGELAALATRGVAALPEQLGMPALDRWFPQTLLVLEGAARAMAASLPAGDDTAVTVVTADGSGDDTIAGLARTVPGPRLVVTADRELRRRCELAGAAVTGPRWLLGLL